ncbi:hypothetical protein NRB56_63440 [Nocardia sp. RB56]|uniref:Putative restriction endonuclease domain-containing protein n=1 Tax=Nocardia aurantia TaxID=2585199 RepID=A0A7K0DYH0_9NOCA|nr:hypothetical protein [Nocardia aurantia]
MIHRPQLPPRGWRYRELRDRPLPFDWDLTDGMLVVRDGEDRWRTQVRGELLATLGRARRAPYAVLADQCVGIDDRNPVRPDVLVVDQTRADLYVAEPIPPAAVALVVEIAPGRGGTDVWYRKPALYAAAGIGHYWRVECCCAGWPLVHEFWLDHESGEYRPSPVAVHAAVLSTTVPYPVHTTLTTRVHGGAAAEPDQLPNSCRYSVLPKIIAASRAEGEPAPGSAPAASSARRISSSPLNTAPAAGVWP